MSDIDIADRANEEIKALLRRLDPDRTVHKDRVRRLQKFKNFVVGENVSFTKGLNLFHLVLCVSVMLICLIYFLCVSQRHKTG